MTLHVLISNLRKQIIIENLTPNLVKESIDQLIKINSNYFYNLEKYPQLEQTEKFPTPCLPSFESLKSPSNLAEAFLWKNGEWNSYKKFVTYYTNETIEVEDRIVFFAFAKHLKNNKIPIFDQHALRAIWAICPLNDDYQNSCKDFLIKKNDDWKDSGDGKNANNCYNLFKEHLNPLVTQEVSASYLDTLLMPLGKAIKKCTNQKNAGNSYDQFYKLCGLNPI